MVGSRSSEAASTRSTQVRWKKSSALMSGAASGAVSRVTFTWGRAAVGQKVAGQWNGGPNRRRGLAAGLALGLAPGHAPDVPEAVGRARGPGQVAARAALDAARVRAVDAAVEQADGGG